MLKKVVKNFNSLNGSISIPADKSMSHRAVIFSSLAQGISNIYNFSSGQDPYKSLNICKCLGVNIAIDGNNTLKIHSEGLKCPFQKLDCGNSGTTMRLMAGVLAGQKFDSELFGDSSLNSRTMKRIIDPLTMMGAKIEGNNSHAPLKIYSSELHGINYNSPISSAQVKSCILLAGLNAEGKTIYTEPSLSRNHTEILLENMGANITTCQNTVTIEKSELKPLNITIFGDISSAAFFIAAGMIVPNSHITLHNVGLNPTRTGILSVAKDMGADIKIENLHKENGEFVGDIIVKYSPDLKGCKINGDIIPKLIDEIPIIAVLATQCYGETVISDAQDLRNKESDRINTTVEELKKLGAEIEQTPDGMIIKGGNMLKGGVLVNSHNDHRLAMSLYVAGLITKEEIAIDNFEWVNISFPEFEKLFSDIKR